MSFGKLSSPQDSLTEPSYSTVYFVQSISLKPSLCLSQSTCLLFCFPISRDFKPEHVPICNLSATQHQFLAYRYSVHFSERKLHLTYGTIALFFLLLNKAKLRKRSKSLNSFCFLCSAKGAFLPEELSIPIRCR